MGHFYRTCVEGLVMLLEIVLKPAGNILDFLFKFVASNGSSNKSSWNSWVVLKRIDRCQFLLSPQ